MGVHQLTYNLLFYNRIMDLPQPGRNRGIGIAVICNFPYTPKPEFLHFIIL